jgi:DedD protein
MDRALKERIIGAAVLVVFVVLVVPVFLDGPPESGDIVSERVPLPGQAAETPQPEPEQTAQNAQPDPEPRPEPEEKPAPSEPAAQQAAVPADSPTGMWAVQLGSFTNQQNAERLAADLRKQGFAAFLSQLSTASGQLHRVRIGPQKDRESAEAIAEKLAKAGHKGQVVPHP